jgi:hypothetical protein
MLTVEHRSLGANLSRCLRGSGVASGSPPTAAADAAISHNRLLVATGAHPSCLPPRTPIPRASRSLYLRLIDGGICTEAVASTREWISLRPRVHYLQGGLNNTAMAGAHQTGAPKALDLPGGAPQSGVEYRYDGAIPAAIRKLP